jgi:arylsulfatase A-like enzyme
VKHSLHLVTFVVASLGLSWTGPGQDRGKPSRPNILLAIADDWSWAHAGAYGDRTVATPTLDRVAREGARFTHAFAASPSCTPSRAALLTGQAVHRLAEGGNLHGFLPERFAVYPDLLEAAGYFVGYMRKGWGPGRFEPGGRSRNPAGPQFSRFDDFIKQRPANRPFCFWFGSQDPHRPYEKGSGLKAGLALDSVSIPAFLPDTLEVRSDLLDYYLEVQRFDREVGEILDTLRGIGELDNTLVVITSDNGMPFPRGKANVYDAGARMPLAVRWPGRIPAGRVIDAFVNHSDLAPTFLDAAGLPGRSEMTGASLMPLLEGKPTTWRDRIFLERERHANVRKGDLSYPIRAVRTRDFLYIRNLRPERWPAGDPQRYFSVGPFGDIDGGPTKTLLLDRRNDEGIREFFELATAKRPGEELYDLQKDPWQIANVGDEPRYERVRRELRASLQRWMRDTRDPRATTDDDPWDRYPYYGQPAQRDER